MVDTEDCAVCVGFSIDGDCEGISGPRSLEGKVRVFDLVVDNQGGRSDPINRRDFQPRNYSSFRDEDRSRGQAFAIFLVTPVNGVVAVTYRIIVDEIVES